MVTANQAGRGSLHADLGVGWTPVDRPTTSVNERRLTIHVKLLTDENDRVCR